MLTCGNCGCPEAEHIEGAKRRCRRPFCPKACQNLVPETPETAKPAKAKKKPA